MLLGIPKSGGLEVVVELAQTGQVAGAGGAAAAELLGVVDLAAPGGLPATRESARPVALDDMVPVGESRSVRGASNVERCAARTVDGNGGDAGGADSQSTAQVRGNWSVAVEFSGQVVQSSQRGRRNSH